MRMTLSQKAQLGSANTIGLIFGITTLWCAWKLSGPEGSPYGNILLCVVGGLFGWVLGILASPLDREEGSKLREYSQLLSAFGSGYVVSKLDRFLELTLFTENGVNWTGWIGVSLFSASLMSVLIPVFVNRSYWHAQRELDKALGQKNGGSGDAKEKMNKEGESETEEESGNNNG